MFLVGGIWLQGVSLLSNKVPVKCSPPMGQWQCYHALWGSAACAYYVCNADEGELCSLAGLSDLVA